MFECMLYACIVLQTANLGDLPVFAQIKYLDLNSKNNTCDFTPILFISRDNNVKGASLTVLRVTY